jgi:hypothetical protein
MLLFPEGTVYLSSRNPFNQGFSKVSDGARGPVDLGFAPTGAERRLNPGFKARIGVPKTKKATGQKPVTFLFSICGRWDLNISASPQSQ